jgi:hypothetical protein
MYKKISISLLLIASIAFSPVAEAKGVPIVQDVVQAAVDIVSVIPIVGPIVVAVNDVVNVVTSTIDSITSSIPVVGTIYDGVKDLVQAGGDLVVASIDKVGECMGVFNGCCICLPEGGGGGSHPAAITIPTGPLSVVISNKDADGVTYINHGFKITWDVPTSLGGASKVGYRIYRGTSQSSLTTLITNTEMDNGQKFFLENRIQNPQNPFWYKVVAFNSAGESVGDAAQLAPTDIRYLTDPLTLVGSGFTNETKVYLIHNGNSILCMGFTASDSHTLSGGTCDITSAPTGTWTVRIQAPDGSRSDCVDCFKITLPTPVSPSVTISKASLNDGVFKIDSIIGDNLYTGATVRVTSGAKKLDCFSLSGYDYKGSKFPGGQCDITAFLKTLGFTSDSNVGGLSVEIVNDLNSAPVVPSGIPSFTCTSSSYTPAAVDTCPAGSSFDQYSNCGVKSAAIASKTCSSGQVCQSGTCVGCTPSTAACGASVCGSVSDGCGGTVSCGTCSSGFVCSNGVCQ